MKRQKLHNSTLSNVSKKRKAEIESGEWKPKPRKPLARQSATARKRNSTNAKATKERAGMVCEGCKLPCNNGDHHHLFKRSTHPHLIDEMTNLMYLCRNCHRIAHGEPAYSFFHQHHKELIEQRINDRVLKVKI